MNNRLRELLVCFFAALAVFTWHPYGQYLTLPAVLFHEIGHLIPALTVSGIHDVTLTIMNPGEAVTLTRWEVLPDDTTQLLLGGFGYPMASLLTLALCFAIWHPLSLVMRLILVSMVFALIGVGLFLAADTTARAYAGWSILYGVGIVGLLCLSPRHWLFRYAAFIAGFVLVLHSTTNGLFDPWMQDQADTLALARAGADPTHVAGLWSAFSAMCVGGCLWVWGNYALSRPS